MADFYDVGLLAIGEWETETYKFCLVDDDVFDATDATLAAVLASNSRLGTDQTVTSPVANFGSGVSVECDDPDFTGTTPGTDALAVVLYRFVTNDADSIPIALQAFAAIDAGDVTTIAITGGAVATAAQAP